MPTRSTGHTIGNAGIHPVATGWGIGSGDEAGVIVVHGDPQDTTIGQAISRFDRGNARMWRQCGAQLFGNSGMYGMPC